MRRTDKKKTFGQQSSKVTQLADTLSQAISMKKFREGDSLPSINQLSAEYGVSRDTVFKAFLDLRERGLIDSTPGKGYYVTSQVTNVLLLLDQYTPFKEALYNSIVKSGAFQKMEKQKSDINFFASMTAIPSTYRDQITMGLPTEVKAEDITLIGGLNFEKGKIALKTENYTENEAVKALLKKQMESVGKANNTFVKYFPASTLMFFNVGVKGGELYNLLSENKEFRNTVSIAKADEVKELFSSFNGDISAGLINVTMSSAPTFMMYADVKNGNALEMIYKNKESLGLKRGEDIMQLGKDEYVYKTRGMNIFFGIKDKQMYATNDELLYKNVGKAADKSVKDAPYASDMKGKSLFIAINAEAILDLPIVKMVAGFGGQEAKTYIELANKVSYLSMSSEGEVSEIDLCLKDKDVNALKQIVDFAKQFAGM